MDLIKNGPDIEINLSEDTVFDDEPRILHNKIIFDEDTCGHVFILKSPWFYYSRDQRKESDKIYLPTMPIYFSQN